MPNDAAQLSLGVAALVLVAVTLGMLSAGLFQVDAADWTDLRMPCTLNHGDGGD